MNCKFCGAPVNENDVLCPHCGCSLEELIPLNEEVTESVVPDEAVEIPQDVIAEEDAQAPFVDLNTEGTMPAPKKRKIGKIILFGIIGLLAVGIILLACNFSSAYSWFKLKTTSGRDLLKMSFGNSLEEFADSYEDYAEDAAEMSSAPQWGTQIQADLEMNEQLASAIDEAFAQQGMDMSLSWLKDLNLDAKVLVDREASTGLIAYGIGMAGEKLLSVESILDPTNEKMWVAYPGLSDKSAYISFGGDKNAQASMENLLGLMNRYGNVYSSEKLESLLKKYGNILVDGFGKVKKSSKTVEIDGISQKLTVLDAYMSEEDAINMCINVLETVKNDQELKQIVLQMGQQMVANMRNIYEEAPYSEEEFYNEFLEAIDAWLEELRNELNDLDMTEEICLTFYMDNDFQIKGCKFTDVNGEELFCYVSVEEKDRYAAEFVAEDVVITDSGTDKDKNTGTLTLSVSGAELLVADYTTTEKNDVTNVSVKLQLGSDLMQQLSSQMGENAAMLYMAGVALQLDGTISEDQAECQLSFVMAGQKFISLNLKQETLSYVQIDVPADGINMDDEEQAYKWMASFDYEGLMDKMIELGLPTELIEELLG